MPRTKKKPPKTKPSRKTKTEVSRPKARRANSRPGVSAKSTKSQPVVASVLNSEKLQELYATMLKCRLLSERGWTAPNGGGSSKSTTAGHEAVFVGAVAHALASDAIAAAQNESLASFIQGAPLQSILKQGADQ